MRKVNLGAPSFQIATQPAPIAWLLRAVMDIAQASNDQITEEVADAYTLSNVTPTRTLDPTTATATDVANVLATLLQDMQKRGVKRG